MGLAFLGSPWLFLYRNRNLCGLVSHYVVNRQFNNINDSNFVLSAPIGLVLIMVLWVSSANTHDLLIPEKSAITAIRMFFSHSILLLLFGQKRP
jgi:hypothetical protein